MLKLDDDMFWISIADSDILLWAKGYALGLNLDVIIKEPDVYPLAVQGPKSEELLVSIFGDEIKKINFCLVLELSLKRNSKRRIQIFL